VQRFSLRRHKQHQVFFLCTQNSVPSSEYRPLPRTHIREKKKMEGDGYCGGFFQRCKPYIAMISLQFGFAGMNIITKVSLNRGMSHYVLVVYRHAFATAAIAPFALVLERYLWQKKIQKFSLPCFESFPDQPSHLLLFVIGRKVRPKITFLMFMQIFVLGLLG